MADSRLNDAFNAIGMVWREQVCLHEYQSQQFNEVNERPVEYGFVFKWLARLAPEAVLDVGTGTTALPAVMRHCGCVVTAFDNVTDYWARGMVNRHWHVRDVNIVEAEMDERFDLITCVSVLEHIREAEPAIASMFSLLNPGGHIALTFPYNDRRYVENVYKEPGVGYGQDYRYPCQLFSRAELDHWMCDYGGTIVDQEYWQVFTGDLWAFGDRVKPMRQVSKDELHHLSCVLVEGRK